MKLKSLIVDDETLSRENLMLMLQKYCPEIEVAGMSGSVADAREAMEKIAPDVVFLDIEMPRENGFDFLASCPAHAFATVFTTAYSQYALRAIKASAVDYLLKPIEVGELRNTIKKLAELHRTFHTHTDRIPNQEQAYRTLAENMMEKSISKLNLHHAKGFKVVDIADIMYLTADSNYTTLVLADQKKIVVSSSLKDFEEVLDKEKFFRAHKSHIVNLDYLDEYTTEDGGYAILKNGFRIEVSKRRVAEFFEHIEKFSQRLRK